MICQNQAQEHAFSFAFTQKVQSNAQYKITKKKYFLRYCYEFLYKDIFEYGRYKFNICNDATLCDISE